MPGDGQWPWSAIPVEGHFTASGGWTAGLAERTGMSPKAIRGT